MEMSLVQWVLNIRVPSLVKVLDQILQQVTGNSGELLKMGRLTFVWDLWLGGLCACIQVIARPQSSIPYVQVSTFSFFLSLSACISRTSNCLELPTIMVQAIVERLLSLQKYYCCGEPLYKGHAGAMKIYCPYTEVSFIQRLNHTQKY